jgi:hypothetical protein
MRVHLTTPEHRWRLALSTLFTASQTCRVMCTAKYGLHLYPMHTAGREHLQSNRAPAIVLPGFRVRVRVRVVTDSRSQHRGAVCEHA